MKLNLLFFGILLFSVACAVSPEKQGPGKVFLNSLGFLPDGSKVATIVGDSGQYFIKDAATHKVVFEGKTGNAVSQQDVDQTGFIADFTSFTDAGTYFLETKNGSKSINFNIDANTYDSAFYTTMRGFYLWRCGMAVEGKHHGITYKQGACHLDDGGLDYTEFGAKHKDGTGGWHDAGDYGKYVVNAGITMGQLFMAWDNFQPKLDKFALDLPETAKGYPEYLEELKWETDWLLKMQYPDSSGRISHKLTRLNFSAFIMADQDTAKRYFTEWGTTATANFVAVMAEAARYFKPYDEAYAKTCLDAAIRSYNFLAKNPDYKRWKQREFRTGGYQAYDNPPRIWAAAELWKTTGDTKYLADFESKITSARTLVDFNWDWGNPKNLGVYTYLLSEKEGRNPELVDKLKQMAIAIADTIVNFTQTDIYGRPFEQYYWGCNGTVARLSSNLYVAYKLTGDNKYKEAGQQILGHIFGRNYYGRSYVTGLGIDPVMHPHDRRSGADGIDTPWPGYLVGGGHKATDWVDKQENYSVNEIAINWQAPLVYTLAWLME